MLLLQQISLEQLAALLRSAQPLPMAVVIASTVVSLTARALRWLVFFLPDRRVPLPPLLGTLAISYMASTFLPFRAGELVRAVFLSRRESLPVARIVGTILIEKLFDFLALAVMLLVLLAITPLPAVAVVAGTSIAATILVGFGGVVALALWREPTLRLLRVLEGRIPLGLGRRIGVERLAAQFAGGTDSLRQARLWAPALGWTAAAWTFSIVPTWAAGRAVGLELGLAPILFLIVLTSTGQAVPSSPGYLGVFHFWAVLALTTFGVNPSLALAVAVLLHALSYGTLVVCGLVALWLGGYGLGDLLVSAPARAGTDLAPAHASDPRA